MKHNVFLINIPDHCGFGGCEKNLIDYFSQIDYSKHKVTLVTTKDVFCERLECLKLPVNVLKFPFKFQGGFIRRYSQMHSLLKKLKPDSVIFVHNGFLQFKLSCFLAGYLLTWGHVFSIEVLGASEPLKKPKKKYFRCIPSLGLWHYKIMFPITARGWLSRRIIAVSQDVKDRMVNYYMYPPNRISVQYHGADINQFHPDEDARKTMREDLGIPENDIVIINVGRLEEQKRIDRLINSFCAVHEIYPNSWLILVGNGPLQKDLEELVVEKRIITRVKFLGFQDNAAPFLQMSDIFALSSDNEGFARVIIEAMASGLVVVATHVPGTKEIIKDGINGFLVELSEKGVADGLMKALSLPEEKKKRISLNAYNTVKNNFCIREKVIAALQALEINAK